MKDFVWPEEGIDLSKDPSKEKPKFTNPAKAFQEQEWHSCINNAAEWKEYMDDELYEMEAWLRGWIDQIPSAHAREARKITVKYALGMMQGEEVDTRVHQRRARKMAKILGYYSVKIQTTKGVWFRGEPVAVPVYTLSKARLKLLPYSLKLRLESLVSTGVMPDPTYIYTWRQDRKNERMPTPSELKQEGRPKSYSKNPKTQANIDRIAEAGRQAYNEYQRERREAEKRGTSYIPKRNPERPGCKAHRPVPDPNYGAGRQSEGASNDSARVLDNDDNL